MLLLCGQRRAMVDRAAIVPCFANLSPDLTESCPCKGKEGNKSTNGLHFFAVYDGHSGSQASQFCMERLHLVLAEELATLSVVQDGKQEFLPSNWQSVMVSCFSRMDKEMGGFYWDGDYHDLGNSAPPFGQSIAPEFVRTTAVVVVVSSNQFVVATCGDSRAVLSRGGKAIPLSLAHKRKQDGATTRCLEATLGQGYLHLKHFVVSEPEVTCIQRSEDDECLILASNGLWDVIDDPTTCEIAQKCLASSRSTQEFGMHDLGKDPAAMAAAAILVKVAFGRGSKDNISAIVIDLKK
ncbi:hypothetical protein GOP47_0003705 [Adiantum capillus-veneris]|uniref:PPM-type phosphatase domain-containing protein n=1 Tax=Adiantum capillus-veneris TaxID=13818 RepID=A0A9D4V6T2_ADICA|nr:hypothetical protein GOP47_0003705 [Adiantum capillus-veneris]